MNKILQTITILAFASAMVVFIFSALRPEQYLAESEFLVISNNIESTCKHQLGDTLVGIINSELFHENLLDKNHLTEYYLKAKKYQNSDIVDVQIGGQSLFDVQNISEKIKEGILLQSMQYYPEKDKIKIKILTDAKIIRTPKTILDNTLKGFLAGTIVGLMITLLTNFRLDIFNKKTSTSKNIAIKNIKKLKKEKDVHRPKKEKDYTEIIKERLEKELSRKSTRELNLAGGDEYVFKTKTKEFSEKSLVSKSKNKIKEVKNKTIFDARIKAPKVRIISVSTMSVNKASTLDTTEQYKTSQDQEKGEDRAPENLPIFIEEKLPENKREKSANNSKESDNVKQVDEQNEINNTDAKKKSQEDISITKDTGRIIKKYSTGKVPGAKKASAHDIANGFAPDNSRNSDNPSNEEIKDRLNKLLRGEL